MRVFNTTAVCIPSKHYMVDLSERVEQIRKLVDDGKYFTINRARQYGKTTTLNALENFLRQEYSVLSLDFQKLSAASFRTEESFVKAFCRIVLQKKAKAKIPASIERELKGYIDRTNQEAVMDELFFTLAEWCRSTDRPVVMIIDEVDSAANNQVFLDFLAQLRGAYLDREKDPGDRVFQSVILAGVTDVKHLKRRMPGGSDENENSPWNIAADFTIDMSLSESGIRGMLDEYEADHHTGMDTGLIAEKIRNYTNGYPFLVSRICQLIDERLVPERFATLAEGWTGVGIDEAIKLLLAENNTLFQSLIKNLNLYPELKAGIRSILMEGYRLTYNTDQDEIARMQMFGFIRNENNTVRIDNRIFETRLYNLFLSEEELRSSVFSKAGDLAKNQFVEDGRLNMRLILKRFTETYTEVFGPLKERFRERDGREQFLLYLKPIINGTGNYYIEAQTRDQSRTDVIVDYLGQQYIIEMKIWRGERYNADGEKQIIEYLDYFGLTTGYMLSFNFNRKKETGLKQVSVGGRLLYEATV